MGHAIALDRTAQHVDDALLARCRAHANRLAFLLESLRDLGESLQARGGALVVRRGDWVTAVIGTARRRLRPAVRAGARRAAGGRHPRA